MHNTPEHALCSNFFSSAEITWAQSLVFITRGQCGLCECRNECEKNDLLHDTGAAMLVYRHCCSHEFGNDLSSKECYTLMSSKKHLVSIHTNVTPGFGVFLLQIPDCIALRKSWD